MNDEELKQRVLELKEEGKSFADIGKELGISRSKAQRLASSAEPPSAAAEEKGFLDVIDRFNDVLKKFGVKDSERIVDYVSSFENIFTDPLALKKALKDQLVIDAKAVAIVKHWCQKENLRIPEETAREIEATTAQPKPQSDRWSLIGDTPTRDPNGELTWLQCLQLLNTRNQSKPQQHGDDVIKLLLEQNNTLMASIQDTRFGTISQQLQALASSQGEQNRYGVLDHGVTGALGELKGLRSDIMGSLGTMMAMQQPPGQPRSREETKRLASLGKEAVEKERRAAEIEHNILGLPATDSPGRGARTPPTQAQQVYE